MPNPTRNQIHVDGLLTNVSVAYLQNQNNFVADRVFPTVNVSKQSDKYAVYDRGDLLRDEMQPRAPATESAGAEFNISQDTYFCDKFALHKDIADEDRVNADSPISLERDTANFLTHKALIHRENKFANTYFTTGVWGSDVTPATLWSDGASDPIEDIRAEILNMHLATGYSPNKLLLGAEVFNVLIDHPDIVDRVKYGTKDSLATVGVPELAALLGLEEVLVLKAVRNSANKGQTEATDAIFGKKNALLLHAPRTAGLYTPTAGYTFEWTGLLGSPARGTRIKRFRMEHLEADRIEIEQAFDQKKVAAELGTFFNGAIA